MAFGLGGWVFKIAPIMKKSVPMPIAEMKSESFLPRVSTPKKMKSAVATTLTTPLNHLVQLFVKATSNLVTHHRYHSLAATAYSRCSQSIYIYQSELCGGP